jgi:hypothetical protein
MPGVSTVATKSLARSLLARCDLASLAPSRAKGGVDLDRGGRQRPMLPPQPLLLLRLRGALCERSLAAGLVRVALPALGRLLVLLRPVLCARERALLPPPLRHAGPAAAVPCRPRRRSQTDQVVLLCAGRPAVRWLCGARWRPSAPSAGCRCWTPRTPSRSRVARQPCLAQQQLQRDPLSVPAGAHYHLQCVVCFVCGAPLPTVSQPPVSQRPQRPRSRARVSGAVSARHRAPGLGKAAYGKRQRVLRRGAWVCPCLGRRGLSARPSSGREGAAALCPACLAGAPRLVSGVGSTTPCDS